MAWLPLSGPVWTLKALDGYDTPIKNGYLNDVVAGDVNGDGRKELIFMESAKNYLDVVLFDPQHKLVPGNRWPVFEQHTFRRPRERAARTPGSAGGGRDRRQEKRPDRAGPRPNFGISAGVRPPRNSPGAPRKLVASRSGFPPQPPLCGRNAIICGVAGAFSGVDGQQNTRPRLNER